MFKIGEKVVYIGGNISPYVVEPNIGEIVTIHSKSVFFEEDYNICEYRNGIDGFPQSFYKDHLRKLDYTFAEEVTARIEEEINQENLVEV